MVKNEATASSEIVRPPGRPMTTGQYSRSPRVSVNELVHEYQEQLGDAAATDEHMLYLRGHLDLWTSQREDEDGIEALLEVLKEYSQNVKQYLEKQQSLYDGETAHQVIWLLHDYASAFFRVHERYRTFNRVTKEIEKRHARFIKLTKVRADIKEKNTAVHQLREFNDTLPKILGILEPRLDDSTQKRLKARLFQEFNSVPMRALKQNTLSQALPASTELSRESSESMLSFLAQRFAAMGGQLDNARQDMLYLKAYLKNMMSLSDTIRSITTPLAELLDELERFLNAIGVGRDGLRARVEDILESYKSLKPVLRLQRGIGELLEQLRNFDAELEDRHAQIIQLALVLAEIQLKEQSADKLMLQRHLLRRLHTVLLEVVTREDVAYVQSQLLEANSLVVPWFEVVDVPVEVQEVGPVTEGVCVTASAK